MNPLLPEFLVNKNVLIIQEIKYQSTISLRLIRIYAYVELGVISFFGMAQLKPCNDAAALGSKKIFSRVETYSPNIIVLWCDTALCGHIKDSTEPRKDLFVKTVPHTAAP